MAAVVVVLIAVIAFLIAVLLDGNIKGKTLFPHDLLYAICNLFRGSQYILYVFFYQGRDWDQAVYAVWF